MRNILLAAVAALALVGCNRAVSNVQTVISDDCGVTWREIEAGQAIPMRVGPCALRASLPNSPMTGEVSFRAAFARNVIVNVGLQYEYTIEDALAFIPRAKYLGRQNAEGDDSANGAARYESAENTIIDSRIRNVIGEAVRSIDIVDFDQAAFEGELLEQLNAALQERGVELADVQFVVTPDDQTRQAIDVVSARRVYASSNIAELGDRVIVSRAGAPHITVDQAQQRAAAP